MIRDVEKEKRNPLCHGLCIPFQNQIPLLSGSLAHTESTWSLVCNQNCIWNSQLSHVSQHKASRLWDAGHLCSSKTWVFFSLSLLNCLCRGNFSDQDCFIGCLLTHAAELSTLSLFPHHARFWKIVYGDV